MKDRWRSSLAAATAAVVALTAVACAAPQVESAATVVSRAERHSRKQIAIQQCMLDAGFEYQPATFVEVETPSPLSRLQSVPLLDSLGYGVGFVALQGFVPRGEPIITDQPSRDFLAEYDAALFGDDYRIGQSTDGGCTAVGTDAARLEANEVNEVEEIDLDQDAVADFLASNDFEAYADRWIECMDGQALAATPFEHEALWQLDALEARQAALDEAYLAETSDGLLHALANSASIGVPEYEQALALSERFQALHDREVAAATRDSECRVEAYAELGEPLRELLMPS